MEPTAPNPPTGPPGGTEHGPVDPPRPGGFEDQNTPGRPQGRIPAGVPWFIAGIAIGAVVGGVGTALALTADFSDDALAGAVTECGVENDSNAVLGDDGSTLVLDHRGGEDAHGLDISDVHCVLSELGIPDNVTHEMEKTRALDGRQDAEWDEITASWSYHPDTGLDVALTRR